MSQVRKAHSVEIIDRRLRDCDANGSPEAIELIGLHDELSRVERKWREKSSAPRRAEATVRPLADAQAMNTRFERLTRLVAVALRRQNGSPVELEMLAAIANGLRDRIPLVQPG